ncbi:hypothetical protein Tco_0988856 [Tanacetum coccineum]|uniref:Uncharacterized protein n=1 Tax=Tanacetum coccineum TaxID=301880 RepID=A0ABQ5ETH1_9ASTR
MKMEILLELTSNKLMVNPHGFEGIFKDGDGVKELQERCIIKAFKLSNQERYEHVGLKVTSSQDCKVYKIAKRSLAWLMDLKNTLAEYMTLSGADNRPPMLDKHMYDSWKSQMELYMENREHRRMILEKIQADCDIKATNIILQGLPADIYSLVNHHRVAKDLWERVQLLMWRGRVDIDIFQADLLFFFILFSFVVMGVTLLLGMDHEGIDRTMDHGLRIAGSGSCYSIGDGLQHCVNFVGHLILLLFEIGFKLGQSSVLRCHEVGYQSF